MNPIQVNIGFGGESAHGLEERFRLSTWAQGTWVSRGDCLSQTRDRLAETRWRQEYLRGVYGGGPSWITLPRAPWPALALGDRPWRDYLPQVFPG
jgi:hypothetical protein